jgi:chorismate dehydratase
MENAPGDASHPTKLRLVIGAVSYLNARPLIHGLDSQPDLDLRLDVPSGLLKGLESRQFDIALLPTIDYQRLANLKIVPAGGIGCDGATPTVRIFSAQPIERIQTLACDPDSHTSVALARIILAERFGLRPKMVNLGPERRMTNAAMLLIGDKVVTAEPTGMPYQLDLGIAWKELTDLPFVFAVWTARGGIDLRDLPQRLASAKEAARIDLPKIIAQEAVPRGWPAELAMQYLTVNLQFDIGPAQLEAIRRFHQLAFKHGIISQPRPLELYP